MIHFILKTHLKIHPIILARIGLLSHRHAICMHKPTSWGDSDEEVGEQKSNHHHTDSFLSTSTYAAGSGPRLYAELVINSSFECPQHLMGWNTYGKVTLMDDGTLMNVIRIM